MRELKFSDVFKMSKILKKIEIKMDADEKSQTQLGAEVILQVGENLHLVEKDVNEFLSGMVGITPEEFGELPLPKVLEYFEEFKKLDGVDSFFKSAGLLSKK